MVRKGEQFRTIAPHLKVIITCAITSSAPMIASAAPLLLASEVSAGGRTSTKAELPLDEATSERTGSAMDVGAASGKQAAAQLHQGVAV